MIRRPKSENEPDASDFTTRSLLMIGPTHFFVLYVPARLPGKLSGSSGGLLGDPTLFAILFESSAYCPDRFNLFLCLLLLSKTKAPGPVASLDSLSQRPRLLLRDETYRSNRGAQHCGSGRPSQWVSDLWLCGTPGHRTSERPCAANQSPSMHPCATRTE